MKHSIAAKLLAWVAAFGSVCALAAAPPPTGPVTEGNLIYDGIPRNATSDAVTLQRWAESRSAGFVDWLADGSMLISTRFANTAQLHRVRAPLGMREQLTWDAEPITSAVAHPRDGNTLLYRKDQGGDENMQIWLRTLSGSMERLLTDGKSLNGPPVFSHDGQRVAFYSNARDGANYDVYISDLNSTAPPRLAVGGATAALYPQEWSVDDRKLAVIRYSSITDSELFIADVATGAMTRVEPAPESNAGPVAVSQARFSRDTRGVYFLSDHGGEFTELHYVDFFTEEHRVLTPQTRWDVEQFELSDDGRFIAYTINEAGVSRLVLHDLTLRADLLLPALPAGAVIGSMGFDRDSKRLAVSLQTAQAPSDVFVYSLEVAANNTAAVPTTTLARWTQSELGPINAGALVAAETVTFPTWDRVGNKQRMLSAYIYRPRTPGPHPVLIDIHGGPESQYRPTWDPFTQYLVNELGYAVVAPNVRGSSGYGRSFLKLDDGVLREDSVRDIGSLLVWIGLQRDLNRARVVVSGGSYGGYMTLASLAHFSDRLAGGIDTVGISNFVTFLTNTSAYRRDLRRAEYGDERDPKMRAFLQGISPLANVKSIRKPLFIVQGLNDPRVPASESEQMKSLLRANGGDVWYLAAKDEGHGFRKKANRDALRVTVVQFLRYLNR
jgi:dipeptidyl aminopeptidase/acylaminoacyl peptidase